MSRPELILIPSPGAGHLVSFNQLARRLVERGNNRFSITILLINLPFDPPKSKIGTSDDDDDNLIRYITLPNLNPPPIELLSINWEKYCSDLIASHTDNVRGVIVKMSGRVAGVIVDLFCTPFIDVANVLDVPSYLFFTSSAAFLCYMLYMPTLFEKYGRGLRESDPDSIVPGFKNPYPSKYTPPFMLHELGYMAFLEHGKRFPGAKGVIINTFAEIEEYPLKSVTDYGWSVYTFGPILDLSGQAHGKQIDEEKQDRIMSWLDAQPESSVVFLCFGSVGSMRPPQMKEVALGLLQSGARFLWAVRKPPAEGKKTPTDYSEDELHEILPAEFMALLVEGGKGTVCGWAPQAEVLAHDAIGGFVSHCGWNSIMEGFWFGRPIVTWPMYAEQRHNAVQLVKEMELAIELSMDYCKDSGKIIKADELERAIKLLMEQDCDLRKRVKVVAEQSRKALEEGGSSFISLGRFIDDVIDDKEKADV
ncbi:hypothetical protein Droror1_Dr00012001 [Drosera rotundifolia]